MHRSGTSALAKLLVKLGFDAGENLMPPDDYNPEGYWEDQDIFNLNNELLHHLGLTWDQIENFDQRRIIRFAGQIDNIHGDQATKIIRQKFEKSNKILIKDPRISVLMPFWDKIIKATNAETFFFHIVRNPLEVALSLQKRNNIPIRQGLLLWYFYNVALLTEIKKPFYQLTYDELLNKTDRITHDIFQYTGSIRNDLIPSEITAVFSRLKNQHASEEEIADCARFLPEIHKLWIRIKFIGFGQKQPCQKNDDPFNKVDLLKFNTGKSSPGIRATAVFHDENNHHVERSGKTLKSGSDEKINFDNTAKHKNTKSISVYFGESPCILKLIKTTINTPEKQIETEPESGNYLLAEGNKFYFDTPLPHLIFSLKEAQEVISVDIICNLILISKKNLDEIIPPMRIAMEKRRQLIFEQGQSISQLLLKSGKLDKELTTTFTECAHLRETIIAQQSRIESLEKKSLWLYKEYQNLKMSWSWQITKPLRFVHKLFLRLCYCFYVILNDIRVGFDILLRDGSRAFIYRLSWYLRGKRLKEDILLAENKQLTEKQKPEQAETSQKIVFQSSDDPEVSIIIPVYNNFRSTLKCLQSVRNSIGMIKAQIIVIDDASSDETRNLEDFCKGISILRNPVNLGFLRSCNKAAGQAKGKYFYFLNNDTKVRKNWLKPLLAVFEKFEKVGIVGSKLVFPDGQLQEAGGIIWNDATGWNYGKGDHPEKSEYNYVKEVDYVSGASLMISKSLWNELRGFDEQYCPAYYEDTDLAYRARTRGYKVMYQPKSVVVHFEGLSNGCKSNSGIKKFQESNRRKFLTEWKKVLESESSPNGKHVFLHRDRSAGKKQLLVIDHYVPHFDQDAGSRSTFSYLKLFLKMGFSVKFIGDNFYRHQPYTSILQQMGIEVLYGDYYQRNIRNWLREHAQFFNFIILHRCHIAPKYLDEVKKYSSAKLAYVGHDLQFLSSRRKWNVTGDQNHKKDMNRFEKIESKIFSKVDIIFPFSTYEAPFIREIAPDKIVQTIPVYFYNHLPKTSNSLINRRDILFVGFFGHPPNTDAALWFCKDVFPLIKKQLPEVRLHIVGSNPTAEILALAHEDIQVTGYVPDKTLKNYYHSCRIAVIPLRFGAGVKGKLLESLYYGIPTVVTPIAAEGVPEIEKHTLIAEDPETFANHVQNVYTDENLWNKYARSGKTLIEKYFTEDAAEKLILEAFEMKKPNEQIDHGLRISAKG